jgi:membrane-bound lytic murein transglycosylase D
MRLANLYVRTAVLASLALAATSCQTAQKPVALLPPATAPSLKAPAAATTPVAAQPAAADPSPAPPQKELPQAETPSSVASEPEAKLPPADSDAVGDLIARVEKEYQSGLSNYQAGKTEEAKQNFDNAFNALLGSTFDVHSDERLQKQFDRMVEGVNRLDIGGFSPESEAQKSEPAPIDETNEIAPSADAGVKAKAQAEIKLTRSDLPLMMTDQVAGYISYFSNRGRGTFERAFARSGRYHDMMVSILKQEGVPQDLIYLAQAESGFHPLAVSRVGARGIWQFMGSRARGYGLSHNMYVDDRQDPEKSTRAAAHHLKDLYNQFGDWYLAMAAYNSGPGTVQAAVKRTGYADFWELYRRNVLPRETRNYVPIILAVTIMAKNLSQYGFDDVSMDNAAKYDTVTINYPVDLRLVAQCVGATQAQLQELNPSLLRLTTPREGKFELHLPAGTKDQYETAIAAIPADMRLWWRYHTVHSGDTLSSLARTYRTTAKSIEQANQLNDSDLRANDLRVDAKLVIPVAPGKHPLNDTAAYAHRITRYKVHKGDTVETVAENFGVPVQMVRRWNGIRGNSLQGRRVLALHLPVTPTAHDSEAATVSASKPGKRTSKPTQTAKSAKPAQKKAQDESQNEAQSEARNGNTGGASVVHHQVKTGETLYSIAQTYRTTVEALKRDNRNVAVLRPGMILVVQHAR